MPKDYDVWSREAELPPHEGATGAMQRLQQAYDAWGGRAAHVSLVRRHRARGARRAHPILRASPGGDRILVRAALSRVRRTELQGRLPVPLPRRVIPAAGRGRAGGNDSSRTAVRISVRGVVQGVGFRPFVYALAVAPRPRGWVRNTSAGVEIAGEGRAGERRRASPPALPAEAPPRATSPRTITRGAAGRADGRPAGFAILESAADAAARTSSSRRTSPPATTADASCSTRPTGATATRSPTAPTAARASPSSRTCPTTASAPRMRAVPAVPGVPARVRRPARPALPRRAQRLPGVRAARAAAARCAGRRGVAAGGRRRRRRPGGSPIRAAAELLRARRDPRRQGPRRLPPRLRRHRRRGGAPPQARKRRPRQAAGGDVRRPRRAARALPRDAGGGGAAGVAGAPDRAARVARRRAVGEPGRSWARRAGGGGGPAGRPRPLAEVAVRQRYLGAMLPYTPLHVLLLRDGRPAAGDDQRQPGRGADRQGLGGDRAAWRRSPTPTWSTTARSPRAATTPSRRCAAGGRG